MKSSSLLAKFLMLFLFACQTETNQAPPQQAAVRDSLENELIATISTINNNLELIRQKQGLIGTAGTDGLDQKTSILDNIQLINALLADNEKQIASLNKEVSALGKHNSALKRLAVETGERISRQTKEILQLKQDLILEEFKVADLSVEMDEMQVENERLAAEKRNLEAINAQFDKNEHLVLITYGTEKELMSKAILLQKKGSKLGKAQLSTTFNRNRSFFTEADLRKLAELPLRGKNPKLLTLHPEDSYRIELSSKDYSRIVIVDQEAFWSISHFLVIMND
jgi:hypothetical protein